MPGSRLQVHLFRDSFNTPWGFRLQGGKDLRQPLIVQRVFSNSPAEGELQRGDVILSINNRDASELTHKQAQDLIKHGGGQVQLVINRPPPGTSIGPLSPPIITQTPRAPSLLANYGGRWRNQGQVVSGTDETQEEHLATGPIPKVCRLRNLGGGSYEFGSAFASATLPRSGVGRRISQPAAHAAGHGFHPTKVTLNQYGGGARDFGSDFSHHNVGQTAAQRYEPHHDKHDMLNRVHNSLDNIVLSPRSPEVYTSSPFYQPYTQPYQPPQHVYTPTGLLLEQQQQQQDHGEALPPVWERRKQFQQGPPQHSGRAPAHKPAPKIHKPQPGPTSHGHFGTDYSHPASQQAQTGWRPAPQFKPSQAPVKSAPLHYEPKFAPPPTSAKQAPPSWQRAHDENADGTPAWRSSLKSTGVKAWDTDAGYTNEQAPISQPGPAPLNDSGERDWSQSAVLRFISLEDTKKSKVPVPAVTLKPQYSPVQASRAAQPYYQDIEASEF